MDSWFEWHIIATFFPLHRKLNSIAVLLLALVLGVCRPSMIITHTNTHSLSHPLARSNSIASVWANKLWVAMCTEYLSSKLYALELRVFMTSAQSYGTTTCFGSHLQSSWLSPEWPTFESFQWRCWRQRLCRWRHTESSEANAWVANGQTLIHISHNHFITEFALFGATTATTTTTTTTAIAVGQALD